MRGLLVFNPEATSVSVRVRDVISHALSTVMSLETAETKRRHHATHLAAGAAHEGFDLVVVLGGDGTLNEVINGVAGTHVAVVPLPGGGTNVFARTMGLPRDPIEATSVVIERVAAGAAARSITVGRVNGRAFGFCAGIGFDAALVRTVERTFTLKKKLGDPLFVVQGLRTFFTTYPRSRVAMSLTHGRATYHGLQTIVVCNLDPYTYLGDRPVRLCPDADPALGLDLVALESMSALRTLRVLGHAFRRARHGRLRHVRLLHDLDSFTISTRLPLPYQVDGDDAGDGTEFRFEAQRDALRVLV